MFVTAEDDMDELHRRLVDIAIDQQIGMVDLEGLIIVSLAGEDAILATPNGKSNIIKSTRLFETLESHVAKLEPALVVLDTLADLFGGEENQRAQARQFISLLRGLAKHHDTTVLLLAHPSLSGMASGSGTSGSTAWSNSVRSRLYLDRLRNDEGKEDDPDARVVRGMKANYGKSGIEIKVRWRAGVFIVQGGGKDTFATIAADAKAERVFMDLLDIYTADGRPVCSSPSPSYAPSTFAKDSRRDGVNRNQFAQAMNRLFNDKRIANVESGPASKRRSRIVAIHATVGDL